MEKSLVLLKPGVLQRRITGELISRIEAKGLQIIGMKMLIMDKELAAKHYAEHEGKDFYPRLESFMLKGPMFALIVKGDNCILQLRKMCGATSTVKSEPGTIRGDLCLCAASPAATIIHASDSPESAAREIPLFFNENEEFDWIDPLANFI